MTERKTSPKKASAGAATRAGGAREAPPAHRADAGPRSARGDARRIRELRDLDPDAIHVHVDDRIAFANMASTRMLGCDEPEDLTGVASFDLYDPDLSEAIDALALFAAAKRHRDGERDRAGASRAKQPD
jgi:hypothetical protein